MFHWPKNFVAAGNQTPSQTSIFTFHLTTPTCDPSDPLGNEPNLPLAIFTFLFYGPFYSNVLGLAMKIWDEKTVNNLSHSFIQFCLKQTNKQKQKTFLLTY